MGRPSNSPPPKTGFIFAISGSTTTVYNDVDKVMLGHYGMTVANGIYPMAYRIVNICTMPIGSIHSAALPRFFKQGVDGLRATAPFARKILKRTTILGVLGAARHFDLLSPEPQTVVLTAGFLWKNLPGSFEFAGRKLCRRHRVPLPYMYGSPEWQGVGRQNSN